MSEFLHHTNTGRVVYDRPKHYMSEKDASRIAVKVIENTTDPIQLSTRAFPMILKIWAAYLKRSAQLLTAQAFSGSLANNIIELVRDGAKINGEAVIRALKALLAFFGGSK